MHGMIQVVLICLPFFGFEHTYMPFLPHKIDCYVILWMKIEKMQHDSDSKLWNCFVWLSANYKCKQRKIDQWSNERNYANLNLLILPMHSTIRNIDRTICMGFINHTPLTLTNKSKISHRFFVCLPTYNSVCIKTTNGTKNLIFIFFCLCTCEILYISTWTRKWE